jgi:hypothetical protein
MTLTEQQIRFIETYIRMPVIIGRQAAQRKRELWATEFRAFNILLEEMRARADSLTDAAARSAMNAELDRAGAMVLASGKTPDFEGGTRHAGAVGAEIDGYILLDRVTAELARTETLVASVLRFLPDNRATIATVLAIARRKAESGGKTLSQDDLRDALAAIAQLDTLVLDADLSSDDDIAKEALRVAPRLRVTGAQGDAQALIVSLTARFASPLPAAISVAVAALQNILDVDQDGEPAAIGHAADAIRLTTAALEAAARPVIDAQNDWDKARAACMARFDVLQRHPQTSEAKFVKPLVDAVSVEIEAAAALADRHDYGGAKSAIDDACANCEAAIVSADTVAEFIDLYADRKERIDALISDFQSYAAGSDPIKAVIALPAVQGPYTAALSAFQPATIAWEAEDLAAMTAAKAALRDLPDKVATAKWTLQQAAVYGHEREEMDDWVAHLEQIDAIDGDVTAEIARLKAQVAASTPGDPPNFPAAASELNGAGIFKDIILGLKDTAADFRAARADFVLRQADILPMQGTAWFSAVAEYHNRLIRDLAHADDRVLPPRREYAMAAALLNASASIHDTEHTKGQDAKWVVETLAWYRANMPANAGGDLAEKVVADLNDALDVVDTKVGTSDWIDASELLQRAQPTFDLAAALENDDAAFSAADNAADVQGMDSDIDKAFQVYDACRKLVTDQNNTDFGNRLADHDAQRDQARVAATTAPADFASARADLSGAIAGCRKTLELARRKARFDTRLKDLRDGYGILDKPKVNIEAALNPVLSDLKQKLDAAEQAANPPGFDFNTAEPLLTSADARMTEAQQKARYIADIVYYRGETRTCRIYLENADRKAGCADEIARLEQNLKDIATDQAAGNLAEAEQKARAGFALNAGFYAIAVQYANYARHKKENVDPALAELPDTRTYSASEGGELTGLQNTVRANVAQKNFTAALIAGWTIIATARRIRILERDGERWTKMKDAIDAKLTTLGDRITTAHPFLSEKIAGLQDAFTAAKEQAKPEVRNYGGALQRAKGLEERIGAVDIHVDGYLACLAARDTAESLRKTMNAISDPQRIEPLITRINAKFEITKAMFDAGSFLPAEAMFQEIARESRVALKALESVLEYAAMTDDLRDTADDDAEGLETAIRRAGMFIEDLQACDEALHILASLVAAEAALQDARDLAASDPAAAKARIGEIARLCAAAQSDLGQYAQIQFSCKFARDSITDLLQTHPEAGIIRADLQARLGAMNIAMDALRGDPAKRQAAITAVEAAIADFRRLGPVADAHIEAKYLIGEIETGIRQLEEHPARHTILGALKQARADLEQGRKDAMARKQDTALPVLRKTLTEVTDALLKARLENDELPGVDELKAILAQKDGSKKLDALISGLDPTAKRKVMKVAFEARFGCELAIYALDLVAGETWGSSQMDEFRAAMVPVSPQDIAGAETELEEFRKRDPAPAPHEIAAREEDLARMKIPAQTDQQIEAQRQILADLIARVLPAPATAEEIAAAETHLETLKTAGLRFHTDEEISAKQQAVNIQERSRNYNPDMDSKAPNIQRFYEVMTLLPDTATLNNDSLGIFTAKLSINVGSAYDSGRREICMGEGDVGAETYYGIGKAHELEGLLFEPEPGEDLTFFNWNTLHEVGHAVDDKLGYMKRRPALGGWKDYGSDVLPVARIVATEFKYDADYVAAYMNYNSNPEIPDPQGGADKHEWEARRLDCRAHVDRIRSTQNPWQTASAAKLCEIGTGADKLCYQESYPGMWTAYPLDERKKGVTGYQFRAPGEWFCELYAAYYSKKLNSNHPARAWLEADFPQPRDT